MTQILFDQNDEREIAEAVKGLSPQIAQELGARLRLRLGFAALATEAARVGQPVDGVGDFIADCDTAYLDGCTRWTYDVDDPSTATAVRHALNESTLAVEPLASAVD